MSRLVGPVLSRRHLMIAVLALLLVAAAIVPVSGAGSASRGEVAFVRDDAIHVSFSDGSRDRALTRPGSALDFSPEWSPGGHVIAFTRLRGSDEAIYLIRPDGTHLRRVTRGLFPAWSPNGKWIAFSRTITYRGPAGDPVPTTVPSVVRPDGTGRHDLAGPKEDAGRPLWSPSGARLVIPTYDDSTGEVTLYTIRPDGSARQRVAVLPAPDLGENNFEVTAWAPGPAILVTTGPQDAPTSTITAVSLNGTQKPLGPGGNARWTPDHGHIVFDCFCQRGGRHIGHWDIWLMNGDGSHARDLTKSATEERQPSWRPGTAIR